ncbi:hypothetical protein [Streptomyces griseorubiginosus]|uniref:hypothetical protein n=1 Tax=Streptomyces griseorubiginosus TaxID=67304 RepID=UPI0036F0C2E1
MSDVWVNVITALSAAGMGALAASLITRGARDAVHRILRSDGDLLGTLAILMGSESKGSEVHRKASEADAEAFLRQYVASKTKARHEVESD